MNLECVCAGIGGRGVLLASTILLEAAIAAGYKAMASDEYGMSQRGGSVVSLVKVGPFKSPLVGRENADILLAFEESEFYRNLPFLKKGGLTIVNTDTQSLPPGVEALLRNRDVRFFLLDADRIAGARGMVQASNMAVLGFLSYFSVGAYTLERIKDVIRKKVKGAFVDKNIEVCRAGYEAANVAHASGRPRAGSSKRGSGERV
jgi:indolepyruvate ferredoxin oxidoreductase, beta subunit